MKKLIIIVLIYTLTILIKNCTPDQTQILSPVDTIMKSIKIYNLSGNNLFINDSSDSFSIFTRLEQNGTIVPIKDSTLALFNISDNSGNITDSVIFFANEAKAIYKPLLSDSSLYEGFLSIKVRFSDYYGEEKFFVKNNITEDTDSIPSYNYTLNLWSMVTDTFFVYDSTSSIAVYADVFQNNQLAPDSTPVTFFCDKGYISPEVSYTSLGRAKAYFSSFDPLLQEFEFHDAKIIATVNATNSIIKDTLQIYLKDIINSDTFPQLEDTLLNLRLWSMVNHSYTVIDSASYFYVYADVGYDTSLAVDHTPVRFYCNMGTITEKSYTIQGQAKALFQVKNSLGYIHFGQLKILASVGLDSLQYDSLSILLKDSL